MFSSTEQWLCGVYSLFNVEVFIKLLNKDHQVFQQNTCDDRSRQRIILHEILSHVHTSL